jgi:NADH dehydrogenase FAD-containing subunit
LHVTANARELVSRANVSLIDPGDFWYSGLATGVLGGMADPSEDCVSVAALAAKSGVRHMRSRVSAIDTGERRVVLADGTRVPYDILSLNIGSEVDASGIELDPEWIWKAKPIPNLVRLRSHLEHAFSRRRSPRVVIIGGGPTGCEIAANIDGLARRRGARATIEIVTSATRVLDGHGTRAATTIATVFARREIGIRTGVQVAAARDGTVILRNGSSLPCDVAVLATGLRAPELLEGLPAAYRTERGLRVDATLRCSADPNLFGAGDCVFFEPKPLAAVGVYAVREAPVLLANLVAAAKGATLRHYEPQSRTLLIMNLGDGRGLTMWGGVSWFGRSSLWLKNRIDRAFLAQYH